MKNLHVAIIAFVIILSSCSEKNSRTEDIKKTVVPAQEIGMERINELDKTYQSAVHSDTSLAVFQSEEDQQRLIQSYQEFLKGFGGFLKANGFVWEGETKCWNRFYFDKDGAVEYYIYDFKTPISKEKEEDFQNLLTSYFDYHKINISANVKFAQCSPVTFR